MDQAVIEKTMEEYLAREHGVLVQYSTCCQRLEIDEDLMAAYEAHACTLYVTYGSSDDATSRSARLRTKYVVGADGSRSWTRSQVGIRMEGARSTQYWGVADIVPLSDFPDIRNRAIIHKESVGTIMTIPREAGMVRLYVQLGDRIPTGPDGQPLGPLHTISAAQNVMHPFRLDYRTCYWSSYYPVEQALASSFSDASYRVFLVGDAIHTHSPKAGQGLNVSIQDGYNLGWKLAAVVKGEARPELLSTYEKDRRPVAQYLVNFDKAFQRFFHEPLTTMHWSAEQYRAAVSEAITTEHAELSGISAVAVDPHMFDNTRYCQQKLARSVGMGKRIPDTNVANQADGRIWSIHDLLNSNGKWRLLVFAGDLRTAEKMKRYTDVGQALLRESSPLVAFESMIDVLTIHASPRHDIDLLQLPEVFHPWSDEVGWDYNKVFADDVTYHEPDASGNAYEQLGICRQQGCILLLRPDQHVCMIMALEGAVPLCTSYLSNWLRRKTCVISSCGTSSAAVSRPPMSSTDLARL